LDATRSRVSKLEPLLGENQQLHKDLQTDTDVKTRLTRELQDAKTTICNQQSELDATRSRVSELEPLLGENQRLNNDLQTATDVKTRLTDELQRKDLSVRHFESELQRLIKAMEHVDRRCFSSLAERDSVAKQLQQEVADNAKLRQQVWQRQEDLDCCRREYNSAKTMLVTQMNRLREANERRFTRIRQLHSEELRTLVATYESRL
jgi:chromosome segregation ATPase